jgi:hypothetical protein
VNRKSSALGLLLACALAAPEPVEAQANKLIAPAIGVLLGTGAGGYVAVGIVAYRARQGRYLYNVQDALGWESAAVLAGGGTGLALGLWDERRLRNTVIASAGLALVGTGIGALVGRRIWPPPEGKWAGGVIGGGVGILLGAASGVLLPPDWLGDDGGGDEVPLAIRIPVGG